MTIEELISQINILEDQLEQLGPKYSNILDPAEENYKKGEYLIAFIGQSLIIEQILKQYSIRKLSHIVFQSEYLKRSFKSFHASKISRLIDDLLIAGKIKPEFYDKIIIYLDKRNNIIHHPEKYLDKTTQIFKDLKTKFNLGEKIINFIRTEKIIKVNHITIESMIEKIAELQALLSTLDAKSR